MHLMGSNSNPTGNISLMLDSKRRLVVLAFCVLLSSKKSLEMVHVPKMELGKKYWKSSSGSLIGFFNTQRCVEDTGNKKLECPSAASVALSNPN